MKKYKKCNSQLTVEQSIQRMKLDSNKVSVQMYKIDLENKIKKLQKEIANRVKNQDLDGQKWGTAPPLVFLLQDVESQFDPINEDEGDSFLYLDEYGGRWEGETHQDIIDQIKELAPMTVDGDLSETVGDKAHNMVNKFVTKYSFLTYDAAKWHLQANKHHYTKDARIWVGYAWRNPEAKMVHKLLLTFAD